MTAKPKPAAPRKPARPAKPEAPAPAPSPAAAENPGTATLTVAFDELAWVARKLLPIKASQVDIAAVGYWASSVVLSLAEKWREREKRTAVSIGVLPNTAKTPSPVGTADTVFVGSVVTIGLRVVEQADRLDGAGLVADLEAAGVSPRLLKRLVKKHTRSFPGAHVFTASLTA